MITGQLVYYIYNLGSRWETRGPVAVIETNVHGCILADNPHAAVKAAHIFKDKLAADDAASRLTELLRRPS